jgi:hypothetical protein
VKMYLSDAKDAEFLDVCDDDGRKISLGIEEYSSSVHEVLRLSLFRTPLELPSI